MSKAATPKKAGNNTLAAKLARLGLGRDADLVVHLPLRYEDETHITMVRDAEPGTPAQFEVEVIKVALVIDPDTEVGVRRLGDITLLSVRELADLQRVLFSGVLA